MSNSIEKEIFRYIMIFFALGFFIFSYLGTKLNLPWLYGLAIICPFIALLLHFLGKKYNLHPEDVVKKESALNNWGYRNTNLFVVLFLIGSVTFIIFGIMKLNTGELPFGLFLIILGISLTVFSIYYKKN